MWATILSVTTDVYWQYCLLSTILLWNMRATILSDDYRRMLTIMSVEYNILLWNILRYCTHESHNIVWWLLMFSDNIVCWIIYILLWNILLYCTFMYATILSVDYWTYADNNVCWVLYCFEIFYYIVYSCEPQYCLLTTDVCWQ